MNPHTVDPDLLPNSALAALRDALYKYTTTTTTTTMSDCGW